MIKNYKGEVCLECDECGEESPLEDTFQKAIDEAKSYGWRIKKLDGEYVHICSECSEYIFDSIFEV